MEEVDNIIMHFLRQLDIEIGEDITQLCDLPVNIIILSVSRCLSQINSNLKVPQTMPQGISQRIEVAAQLASMCKDLGYKNEVGYQTFLYYNEADLRKVFMFLIEHLPTDDKGARPNTLPMDKKSLLYRKISQKINEDLNKIWVPTCHNVKRTVNNLTTAKRIAPTEKDKLIKMLLKAKHQKQTEIAKCNNEVNLIQKTKDEKQQEAKEIKTTKTLKELREEVILLRQKLSVMESERNADNAEYAKIQKSQELVENELKSVETILQSLNISSDEGVTDLLNKMRSTINTLHSRSEGLTSKNLSLKTEIDTLKANMSQSERSECKKSLLTLKETAKYLKDECSSKEELKEQLRMQFNKINRGNKRTIYTKRILEIISNVDKQNLEIKKILEDTRELQKEINTLEGQLDRCFSIADETLFKDAKKDDQAKKAYKLLALLHSECNTIVSLVNDTGTLSREIVDLEDHVNTEKTKQTEKTLERIQMDLSKLQQES